MDFDTFSKSDFRAVKVKDCEAVKKSKKLLKFALDDGTGVDRTILSAAFTPITSRKNWWARRCVAITNLPPRPDDGHRLLRHADFRRASRRG